MRDIVDIWLLEALLEPNDWSRLRDACVTTFQRRQCQAWPPVVTASLSWELDYDLLVEEHPEAPETVDLAVDYLEQLVARIEQG